MCKLYGSKYSSNWFYFWYHIYIVYYICCIIFNILSSHAPCKFHVKNTIKRKNEALTLELLLEDVAAVAVGTKIKQRSNKGT